MKQPKIFSMAKTAFYRECPGRPFGKAGQDLMDVIGRHARQDNHLIRAAYLLLCTTLLVFMLSCDSLFDFCIDGNGVRTTETRPLEPFRTLQVNGDFEVEILKGTSYSAAIQADENLMDNIMTHVSGSRLIVESRRGACLRPTRPIDIRITAGELSGMELNGSGYIYCENLDADDVEIQLSGSGQVDCQNLIAGNLNIELEGSGIITAGIMTENAETRLEGSGDIFMTGSAGSTALSVSGSGRIVAQDMVTAVCDAYISGSGTIRTHVLDALKVRIIGSGTVYYRGNPAVESDISGSGRVIKQ